MPFAFGVSQITGIVTNFPLCEDLMSMPRLLIKKAGEVAQILLTTDTSSDDLAAYAGIAPITR